LDLILSVFEDVKLGVLIYDYYYDV